MKSLLATAALCLPLLCGSENGYRGAPAPHETLLAIIKGLRQNDLRTALRLSVGEEQFKMMRALWDEQRKTAADPADDGQFRAVMAMLTAPGAEETLMAQVEPKLAELRPQVAMFVGMISGIAGTALQQDTRMSAEEKAQARQVIDALSKHLMQHDVTDPVSARKAVGIVCSTARKLGLASLADIQKLSFDQLLAKAGVAFGGMKELLAVYELRLDSWLDSVRAETVSQEGDYAVVRVEFEIFGVRTSSEAELVLVGDAWVPKQGESPIAALGG